MNKDLTIALYSAINEQDRPRDIQHWHASSIAKCPRALYFERKGIPGLKENKPGGGKKLRWRSGHAIESTIRPELEKVFPGAISNVRFTNEELDLTGEFDLYHPESKTLISVKSIHDFAMKTLDGTTGLKEDTGAKNARGNIVWGLKKEPYIHHQWQEHAYVLLMSHKATQVNLNLGGLSYTPDLWSKVVEVENITYVYISLGGLIVCYTTPVNPEILDLVTRKVAYLNDCWSKNEVPACLCQEGREMYQVQDQYCPYRTETGCCNENLIKEAKDEVVR